MNTENDIQKRRELIMRKREESRTMHIKPFVDGNLESTIINLDNLHEVCTNHYLNIDIVIPFFGNDVERLQNLKTCVLHVKSINPKLNITVIEQNKTSKKFIEKLPINYMSVKINDSKIHKSKLLNYAFDNTKGDLFIMLDCDMIINPSIVRNFFNYSEKGCLTLPYYEIGYTTQKQKQTIITNNVDYSELLNYDLHIPNMRAVGGCCICYRDDILSIGKWDEKFIGWGGEDTAFAFKFTKLLGGIRHLNVKGIHLWHETDNVYLNNESTKNPNYLKNISVLENSKRNIEASKIPIWYPMYLSKNKNTFIWELFMLHSFLNAASLNNLTLNVHIITNSPDDVHEVSTHYKHNIIIISEFPSINECYDIYNVNFLNEINYDTMLTHYLKVFLPSIILKDHDIFAHIDNDILFTDKNPVDWIGNSMNSIIWSSDLSYGLGPSNLGAKWMSTCAAVLPNLRSNIGKVYENIHPILKNKTLINHHNNGSNYGDELAYVYTMHNLFRNDFMLNKSPIKVDSRIIGLAGTDMINFSMDKYSGIHFGGESKISGKRSCEITNVIWDIIDRYNNTKKFNPIWFKQIKDNLK